MFNVGHSEHDTVKLETKEIIHDHPSHAHVRHTIGQTRTLKGIQVQLDVRPRFHTVRGLKRTRATFRTTSPAQDKLFYGTNKAAHPLPPSHGPTTKADKGKPLHTLFLFIKDFL